MRTQYLGPLAIDKNSEGAWRISAIVREPNTPFTFYETRVFYFYTKQEAIERYREAIAEAGMTLVKD